MLIGISLCSALDVFDIFDVSSLLIQYSFFLTVFCVCGFACDNHDLRRHEVILLPSRPPKPRGYYASRRKHRHYFRRKFWSSNILLIRLQPFDDFDIESDDILSSLEESKVELDRVATTMHKLLHLSWVTIELNFDINLTDFVRMIDPLHTFRLLKLLHSSTMFHRHPVKISSSNRSCFPLQCTATTNINPIHAPSFQFASAFLHSSPSAETDSESYSFLSKSDDLPIVLDTGASTSLTPILSDFIGPLEPAQLSEIRGLTATTKVVGRGKVQWTIRDYWNVTGVIETDAYYVPDASIRLFSPQFYFQEYQNNGRCIIQGMKTTLELPDKTILEFPYNPQSNLPLMLLTTQFPWDWVALIWIPFFQHLLHCSLLPIRQIRISVLLRKNCFCGTLNWAMLVFNGVRSFVEFPLIRFVNKSSFRSTPMFLRVLFLCVRPAN
jgi:hypothetical protein